MNVEQRVRSALRDGATRLHVPEAGPGAARERASRRAHRLQGVAVAAVVAAVAAGAVTLWGGVLDPRVTVVMDGGDDAEGAGSASSSMQLAWQEGEGTLGSTTRVLSSSDGAYYALSTAPGARYQDYPGGGLPQALYRSEDGLDWEVVPQGDEPWIAQIGERDGLLYALSTAVGMTGAPGRIGLSQDGGQTWQRADLPSTAEPPEATVALQQPFVTGRLAVGEDMIVAVVRTTYALDLRALQEPGEGGHEQVWTRSAEGFELYDVRGDALEAPEQVREARDVVVDAAEPAVEDGVRHDAFPFGDEEPVRVVTWDDLGLAGPQDLEVDEVFVSHDGAEWETVPSPFGGRDLADLVATPDGFVAALTSWTSGDRPTLELLRSTDGVQWAPLAADGPLARTDSLQGFGVVESGRLIAVSRADGRTLEILTSDDGGQSWSATDLRALVPGGDRHHVAPVRFGTGPLGAALAVAAYDPTSDAGPDYHLLTSADGTSWAATPLGDVVGRDGGRVAWVGVGGDSVAVGVIWPPAEDGAIAPSSTFVGTPTR